MNKFEAVLLFSPNLSSPLITKEEKSFTKNIENSKISDIEILRFESKNPYDLIPRSGCDPGQTGLLTV